MSLADYDIMVAYAAIYVGAINYKNGAICQLLMPVVPAYSQLAQSGPSGKMLAGVECE
jgi:hypothetical protein